MAEDFEQTQSIVNRIQGILREYPCADTIIFELVQNADDAKADRVHIRLAKPAERSVATAANAEVSNSDTVRHSCGWNRAITDATTPALFFYNSAVFTDRDLTNIRQIGGAEGFTKRHDATKVGRFGVGFNSTFHLTDVVAFVSRNFLVVLDPAREHIPLNQEGRETGGLKWDYLDLQKNPSKYPKAHVEFAAELLSRLEESQENFDRSKPYQGTLFRLPLRQRKSKLWKEIHTIERIQGLLDQFQDSARVTMTLLKSVRVISAWELQIGSPGAPLALFDLAARLDSNAEKVKLAVVEWLKSYTVTMGALAAAAETNENVDPQAFLSKLPRTEMLTLDMTVSLRARQPSQNEEAVATANTAAAAPDSNSSSSSSSSSSSMKEQTYNFSVCHWLGPADGWSTSSKCWLIAQENARYQHPIAVPWSAAIAEPTGNITDGRMLCFFPIKGTTGLPVHIHGYFQLSSDRQSVQGINSSRWNTAMCQEVIPGAFSACVLKCAQRGLPAYQLWPSKTYTDPTVRLMAERTLLRLIAPSCKSLYTPTGLKSMHDSVFFLSGEDDHLHAMLCALAPAAVTSPIPKDDLKNLPLLVEAIRRATDGNFPMVADATYYRRILQEQRPGATSPSSVLASKLFLLASDDLNYAACAQLTASLTPLHNGTSASWANRGAQPLLVAESHAVHRLAARLPKAEQVLVMSMDDGDESALQAKPDNEAADSAALPPPPQDPRALTSEQLLALRKRFKSVIQLLPNGVQMLSAEGLFKGYFQKSLHNPRYVRETPSAPWTFAMDQTNPRLSIPVAEIMDAALAAPNFKCGALPLLPIRNVDPIVCALEVTSASSERHVCIVTDLDAKPAKNSRSLTAEETQQVCTHLVHLGATPLHEGIVPLELLRRWSTPSEESAPCRLFTVTGFTRSAVVAIQQLFSVADAAKRNVLMSRLQTPNCADTILGYVTMIQDSLLVADIDFVKTLPIFVNLWGIRVRLDAGDVFRLPDALPDHVLKALMAQDPSQPHSFWKDVVLLPHGGNGKQEGKFLQILRIDTVHSLLLRIVAALTFDKPRIGAPPPPEWDDVFQSLGRFMKAKQETTPLMRRAIDALASHAFLPTLKNPEQYVAPKFAVHQHNLPPELIPLLIDLQPDAPERMDVDSTDDASAAPPFVPLQRADRHPNENPKNSNGTRSANAASAKANSLTTLPPVIGCVDVLCSDDILRGDALFALGCHSRVDGELLVATVEAFAVKAQTYFNGEAAPVPSLLTRIKKFGAICVMALEDSEKLSKEQWTRLRASRFVPVVLPEDSSSYPLAQPDKCRLPHIVTLCPIASFSRIDVDLVTVMQGSAKRRGLQTCAQRFDWAEDPEADALVRYINWCQSFGDREEVRRVAKDMWKTYELLDSLAPSKTVATKQLKSLYFPDRNISISICDLALHPSAQGIEPELGCVDRSMAAKFPNLVRILGIPATHAQGKIVQTIRGLCQWKTQQAPSRLADDTRLKVSRALEYLCEVGADLPKLCKEGDLPIPTSDGGCNSANAVAYDFYNLEDQVASKEVLHSCVSANVARKLGMVHTGVRYLKELTNQQQQRQGAFRFRGQRQSLVNAIARILGDYADPQAIFLEMLQNADDAGAGVVRFYLDERTFPTEAEGLLGDGMKSTQGPALVIFNDQLFSSSDFDALMELGCGHKSQDVTAIGRFGVGFNSVYHMTDCPCIISGSNTVFLDPTTRFLSSVSADNPGLMIEHTREPQLLAHFPHQFAMFERYGINFKKSFHGTIIRLPLRTEPPPPEDAKQKNLSSRVWTANEVRNMFYDFRTVLPHVTLFLKHVHTVEFVSIAAPGGSSVIAQTVIANTSEVMASRGDAFAQLQLSLHGGRSKRRAKTSAVEGLPEAAAPAKVEAPITNNAATATASAKPQSEQFKAYVQQYPVTVEVVSGGKRVYKWLVTTVIYPQRAFPGLESVPEEMRAKLVPWGSSAILMDARQPGLVALGDSTAIPGRLNCYLPLPVKTGFPFQLHGCFALSSDRRGMWVESVGSTEAWESTWNKFVMGDILSEAVALTLLRLRPSDLDPRLYASLSKTFHELWPLKQNIAAGQFLVPLVEKFYEHVILRELALFGSPQRSYVPYQRACFVVVGADGSRSSPERRPQQASASASGLQRDTMQALMVDEVLCDIPAPIFSALEEACKAMGSAEQPWEMSPEKVAKNLSLRASMVTTNTIPFESVFDGKNILNQDERAKVMAEIAIYVTTSSAEMPALDRVPLVLLENGTLGIVSTDAEAPQFFLPTNRTQNLLLFPEARNQLVDSRFWHFVLQNSRTSVQQWQRRGVSELGLDQLSAAIKQFGGRYLAPSAMAPLGNSAADEVAAVVAPAAVAAQRVVVPKPLPWDGQPRGAFGLWLAELWRFIEAKTARVSQEHLANWGDLRQWPIIPCKSDGRCLLMPLGCYATVFSGTVNPEIQDAFCQLGVQSLDTSFTEAKIIKRLCEVPDVEAKNCADLMRRAKELGRFDGMSSQQRESLLQYLLKVGDNNTGFMAKLWNRGSSNPMIPIIRELPLFEAVIDGKWVWKSIPDPASCFALPDYVERTKLCDGYYRKPCDPVGLQKHTLSQFYITRWANAVRNNDTVPLSSMLSLESELELLRVLARHPDCLRDVAPTLRTISFVCGTTTMKNAELESETLPFASNAAADDDNDAASAAVASAAKSTAQPFQRKEKRLRELVIDFIIDTSLDYEPMLREVNMDRFIVMIRRAEFRTLDRKKRYTPTQCVRPLKCADAPIPSAVPQLLRFDNTLCMLPDVVWRDPALREVLRETGVAISIPTKTFTQAANKVQQIAGISNRVEKLKAFRDHGIVGADELPSMTRLSELLEALSVSVVLSMVEFGERHLMSEIYAIPFMIPDQTLNQILYVHNTAFKAAALKDMCLHKHRYLCFTQRPICSPKLDLLASLSPNTAQNIPPPETPIILAHIVELVQKWSNGVHGIFELDEMDKALEECYGFLVTHRLEEIKEKQYFHKDDRQLLVVQKPGGGGRALTSFSRLISVPRCDSVAPYFYQLSDFDHAKEQQRLIMQALPPLLPPSPMGVIDALKTCYRQLSEAANNKMVRSSPSFEPYVRLLHLLILSAEFHKMPLSLPSGTNKNFLGKDEKALVEAVIDLWLPLANGGMGRAPNCVMGDSPSVLKRVRTEKMRIVDKRVALEHCRRFGVPSALTVIKERPVKVSPAPATTQAIERYNRFLQSSTFKHVLSRMIATEAAQKGAQQGTSVVSSPSSSSPGRRGESSSGVGNAVGISSLPPALLTRVQQLRVVAASFIECRVVDVRMPHEDIANDSYSPPAAFDAKDNSILLVVAGSHQAEAQQLKGRHVDPSVNSATAQAAPSPIMMRRVVADHFIVASEINNALDGELRNLGPLASILQAVGEGMPFEVASEQLDFFGYVSLDAGNATVGSVCRDDLLAAVGRCRRPTFAKDGKELSTWLDATRFVGRLVVQLDGFGLQRWAAVELPGGPKDDASADLSNPALIIMPPIVWESY